MTIETCPKYEGCSAILCPLATEDENNNYIWYPDEDICARYGLGLDWIKRQKKIAKRAKEGYFTFAMLKRNFIVGNGLQGLDPDELEESQLQKWLKKHPIRKVKKEMSEAQKEIGRQALKQYWEKKKEHAPA